MKQTWCFFKFYLSLTVKINTHRRISSLTELKRIHAVRLTQEITSGASPAAAAVKRRPASSHTVDISCGTVTARAAFSHVPFWQSLSEMISRIVARPTPGNAAAPPKRHGRVEQVCALPILRGDLLSCSKHVCMIDKAFEYQNRCFVYAFVVERS